LLFQNKHKIKLEEYLIFSNSLPSALLEYFAFKEVYGQKGLPQWGRGLKHHGKLLMDKTEKSFFCERWQGKEKKVDGVTTVPVNNCPNLKHFARYGGIFLLTEQNWLTLS
jgi:hypothetical protein